MPTRRRLLDWFLGTSAGALCAAVLYPVLRYLSPPGIPEAATSQTVAGGVEELTPNQGKVFPFDNRPAILIRRVEGDYRALSAVCTHLNCTVQYRPDLKLIWCACHNGLYDLTGKNISGPPPRPLEAYRVDIVRGQVMVSRT